MEKSRRSLREKSTKQNSISSSSLRSVGYGFFVDHVCDSVLMSGLYEPDQHILIHSLSNLVHQDPVLIHFLLYLWKFGSGQASQILKNEPSKPKILKIVELKTVPGGTVGTLPWLYHTADAEAWPWKNDWKIRLKMNA